MGANQPISAEADKIIRETSQQYSAIEAQANAELGNLFREGMTLKRLPENIGNQEIADAIDYVQLWIDEANRIQRGAMRNFIYDQFIGSGEINSMSGAARWRRFWAAKGLMDKALTEESRALSTLLRDGNYAELAGRLRSGQLTLRREWWEKAGWAIETQGDALSGIRTPFHHYFMRDEGTLRAFLRANSATDDEVRNLIARSLDEPPFKVPVGPAPAIDPVAEQALRMTRMRELDDLAMARAFPEGAPPADDIASKTIIAEARDKARTPEELEEFQRLSEQEAQAALRAVADAAEPSIAAEVVAETDAAQATDVELQEMWQTITMQPIPGGRLAFGYARGRLPDGTPVLSSFDSFQAYLTSKIDEAVQAGNTAKVESLRARLQNVR